MLLTKVSALNYILYIERSIRVCIRVSGYQGVRVYKSALCKINKSDRLGIWEWKVPLGCPRWWFLLYFIRMDTSYPDTLIPWYPDTSSKSCNLFCKIQDMKPSHRSDIFLFGMRNIKNYHTLSYNKFEISQIINVLCYKVFDFDFELIFWTHIKALMKYEWVNMDSICV
jgi:hypothetical protein